MEDESDQPATLLSYEEVRPQSFRGQRTSTRLAEYRRKLRRQRNRRIAFIVASTSTFFSLGIAYKAYYHRDFTFQHFVSKDVLDLEALDQILDTAAERMQFTVEQIQKAINNATSPIFNSNANSDDQEEEKAKKTSLVQQIKEEILEVIEPPFPVNDTNHENLENAATGEEKPLEPAGSGESIEEDKGKDITKDGAPVKPPRPPLCNIPLSYVVHRKCRRLAAENPVFNLSGLVQDMMQ